MKNLEIYDRVVLANIDETNDFSPVGALPVEAGFDIIEPTNTAGRWVRDKNGIVVFTRDWHPKVTNHFDTYGGPFVEHSVADTWGSEFIPGLEILEDDYDMKKGMQKDEDAFSGFMAVAEDEMTIETLVRPTWHERVAIIIGGLATDYCVKATALDAAELAKQVTRDNHGRKLGVFVLEDAIGAVNINPGDEERAKAEMLEAGVRFITTDDLVNDRVIEIAA